MTKKTFFQERTETEIRALRQIKVDNQRDLVQRINDLNPSDDALEIDDYLIPSKYRSGRTGAEASRKCYKHGNLIPLLQPTTLGDTYKDSRIPVDLRALAFSRLKNVKQQNMSFVGYSWRPVFGNDKLKRIVPFVALAEGAKLFTYAENYSAYQQDGEEKRGIKVEEYGDANRVRTEGENVIVEIPSRTKKQEKYRFGLIHVPYTPNDPVNGKNNNLAISLSLRPAIITGESAEDFIEPTKGRTLHDLYDIQYKFKQSTEQSAVLRFTPQDITGYLGVIKKQLTEGHNITALQFNPFALLSQHGAEFYKKLCNNILIKDPTLTSKRKLRNLHLAEKSILLARAITHFGHNDFAYWDPTRDGIFKNYNW